MKDRKQIKRWLNSVGKLAGSATGERGLLLAVIKGATNDYLTGNEEYRQDAAAYFRGETYKHHLGLLGLPQDWLPQNVKLNGSYHEEQKAMSNNSLEMLDYWLFSNEDKAKKWRRENVDALPGLQQQYKAQKAQARKDELAQVQTEYEEDAATWRETKDMLKTAVDEQKAAYTAELVAKGEDALKKAVDPLEQERRRRTASAW